MQGHPETNDPELAEWDARFAEWQCQRETETLRLDDPDLHEVLEAAADNYADPV